VWGVGEPGVLCEARIRSGDRRRKGKGERENESLDLSKERGGRVGITSWPDPKRVEGSGGDSLGVGEFVRLLFPGLLFLFEHPLRRRICTFLRPVLLIDCVSALKTPGWAATVLAFIFGGGLAAGRGGGAVCAT